MCFRRVLRDPPFYVRAYEQRSLKLIAFSSEHLRLDEPLPFGVRDAAGRLLLGAGATITSADKLQELAAQPLFADEVESTEWRRKLAEVVGSMVRGNAALKTIADARPPAPGARTAVLPTAVPEQCEEISSLLRQALRQAPRDALPDAEFVTRLRLVHERALQLAQSHTDAALYHLIHAAGQHTDNYSSQHALLVMLVCEQAASALRWSPEAVCSLGRAALSMNVAMAALQDQLAGSELPPTLLMREKIRDHAAHGARLLRGAGVDDELWCEVVRLHHDASDAHLPLHELSEPQRLARLLRRADIFTAKISRRRTRMAMSPVQAAREACLGANGVPDEIGGALLRATGLYPPGSFVELVNGERGIVVARGRRANLPYVASLVAPSGMPLGEPALRDTIEARFAVRAALPSAQVKVRPDHRRILALR